MGCDVVVMVQNSPTITSIQNNPLVNESQVNFLVPIRCFNPFPVVATGYLLQEDGVSKIILEDGSGFIKLEN